MASTPNLLGKESTLETPARKVLALTSDMVSDTADLTTCANAIWVYNSGTSGVTMVIIADGDTSGVAWTFAAGLSLIVPLTVKRILSTGSTNLAANLGGTFQCNLILE